MFNYLLVSDAFTSTGENTDGQLQYAVKIFIYLFIKYI